MSEKISVFRKEHFNAAHRLNKSISYSELKKINKGDMNKETELYEIEVNDVPIIIAIGNIQNNYKKDNNVVYFPIYFIKKNKKAVQIGLYEIYFNELQNYLDENQELDIERLEPLIYGFVNNNFLEKNRIIEEELKEINEGTEEKDELEEGRIVLDEKIIPENRRDIFTINPETIIPNSLKEETEKQANDYVEKYNESNMDNWVQKFMKNKNYILQDNEGGGDCFFSTIRDAFKSIGQQPNRNNNNNNNNPTPRTETNGTDAGTERGATAGSTRASRSSSRRGARRPSTSSTRGATAWR